MSWLKPTRPLAPFPEDYPELRAILPKPAGDIELRISNTFFITILLSLLLHLLVLLWAHIDIKPVKPMANPGVQSPLDVSINPGVPLVNPTPQHTSTPPIPQPVEPTPRKTVQRAPHPTTHPVMTTRQASPVHMPPPAPPVPPQATDMASYVKMMRERNHTNQLDEPTGGQPEGQTTDAKSDAIQRNLNSMGGGGIFQITRLDSDSAAFIFRGWGGATWSSPLNQRYYVHADDNTDIQHALVRKMIAIIREKHNGNFEWYSQRLGPTITKSARPEDNAELENFLIKEFFYDYPQTNPNAPHAPNAEPPDHHRRF